MLIRLLNHRSTQLKVIGFFIFKLFYKQLKKCLKYIALIMVNKKKNKTEINILWMLFIKSVTILYTEGDKNNTNHIILFTI